MRKALLIASMISAVVGCSHELADEYQELDEKWSAQTFPRPGISLHQTLAGLHAPREGDHRVVIHKIEILRTDVTPWKPVEVEEARANSEFGAGRSFAVIAHRLCTSAIKMQRGSAANSDWFLLTKNRLSAYDYQLYSYRCLQSNRFRPAGGQSIETERELQQYVEDNFPASILLSVHVYRKGIEFAQVGRVEDAELALANGDSRFDPTSYSGADRREGSRGRSGTRSDMKAVRIQLVSAIQQAREVRLNPVLDAAPHDEPTEASPDEERERLRQEITRQDRERQERWEREYASRRFFETEGGWMLVDEYRRKRGPAEGEVWLTLEEVKRIDAEREQARGEQSRPSPTRELVAVQPEPARPEPVPLFVEADGEWIPVTESQRARGARRGENWITWDERQLLEISRELGSAPPRNRQFPPRRPASQSLTPSSSARSRENGVFRRAIPAYRFRAQCRSGRKWR